MSKISNNTREKLHSFGDHHKFLSRIQKTLYYGKLPTTDRFSLPVTEFATELFSEAKCGRSIDRLHCNDAAAISRNACVSPCSLVLALLYLDRLKKSNPSYLQKTAPSDLFLVSLMISSKFLFDDGEDDEVFMDEWAKSGGISIKELVDLEKKFLSAIQWEIFVNEINFWKKLQLLEMNIAKRQGFSRGWYTYTELNSLLQIIDFQSLINSLLAISAILVTAYTAGIITLLGSMFIVSYVPGIHVQKIDFKPAKLNEIQLPINVLEESNNTDMFVNVDDYVIPNLSIRKQSIDATDVLKTSIILATLPPISNFNSNCSCYELDEKQEKNNITWDWWTNAMMIWLAEASKFIEKLNFIPTYFNFNSDKYRDMCIAFCKKLDLEDQVHKATKIRIQEQMERSWHKEWTDTIKECVFTYNLNLAQYFQYVKF